MPKRPIIDGNERSKIKRSNGRHKSELSETCGAALNKCRPVGHQSGNLFPDWLPDRSITWVKPQCRLTRRSTA